MSENGRAVVGKGGRGWVRWLPEALIVLAAVSAITVAAAGPLYRFEIVGLGQAFSLLRVGAIAAVSVSVAGLVLLGILLRRPDGRWRCVAALVIAAPAFLGPWSMVRTASQVPPIHDISTDLEEPPAFHVLAERRRQNGNRAAYPGEDVAEQQREEYADIRPLRLSVAPARALEVAVSVARTMGWELAAVDRDAGRLEAVAVTPWWGFRDDVVVRIRPAVGGSRMDTRSASRVGVSDLGQNAQRIRAFQQRVLQRVRG